MSTFSCEVSFMILIILLFSLWPSLATHTHHPTHDPSRDDDNTISYDILYGLATSIHLDLLYTGPGYLYQFYATSALPVFVNNTACLGTCSAFCKGKTCTISLAMTVNTNTILQWVTKDEHTDVYHNDCLQDVKNSCKYTFDPVYMCLCSGLPPQCGLVNHMNTCQSTVLPSNFTRSTNVFTTTTPKTTTLISTMLTTTQSTPTTTTHLTTTMPSTSISSTTEMTTITTPTMTTTTSVETSTPVLTTTPTTPVTTTTSPTTETSITTRTTTITSTASTTHATVIPEEPTLKNLSDSGVGLNNVTYVLNVTNTYSEQGPALSSQDVFYICNILQDAANLKGLHGDDAIRILQNMDNVLNAHESTFLNSSSENRYLDILPTMVINSNATTILYNQGKNIGFVSNKVLSSNSEFNGLIDENQYFEPIRGSIPEEKNNGISIDQNVISQGSHVLFTIYRNRKFFTGDSKFRPYGSFASQTQENDDDDDGEEDGTLPLYPSKCDRQTQVSKDSPVMSATLINNQSIISKLDSQSVMANLQFNITKLLNPLHGHFRVTWWNKTSQTWSLSGECTTKIENGMIYAQCPHLTDFTLIVDSQVNDPVVCDPVLMDVGMVTNVLSIAALAFLFAVQASAYVPFVSSNRVFRKLRGDALHAVDSIQTMFNAVLCLFYLVFVCFSNQKTAGSACNFFAALSYSLLLCSLLLTIFQALRTVVMFFPMFFRDIFEVLVQPLIALTIGFLVPFIISVLLAFFTPFFKRDDEFCWVRPDLVVYAIIIPISVLIINAIICTAIVCWRIFGTSRRFARMGKQHGSQLKTRLMAIVLMQVTMGTPWILQYLTLYHSDTTVWHYVFTLVMGSQGIVMMLLFFYKRRRMQLSSKRMNKVKNQISEVMTKPSVEGLFTLLSTSFPHQVARLMSSTTVIPQPVYSYYESNNSNSGSSYHDFRYHKFV